MDELDLIRVRIATEDNAGRYFGGPLGLSQSDAARYTSEGHLSKLCDRYGLATVWRAVAEVIEARPELLTDSEEVRQQRARDRAAACEAANVSAGDAYKAGNYPAALAALDEGDRADPDHRVNGRHSWASLRELVHTKREDTKP